LICRLRIRGRGTYRSAYTGQRLIDSLSPCRPTASVLTASFFLLEVTFMGLLVNTEFNPDPFLLGLLLTSGAIDVYRYVDKTSKKTAICHIFYCNE